MPYPGATEKVAAQKVAGLESYFNPLDIGRVFIADKNEKIYCLIIETLIRRGVLHRLSETAEKLGITVLYIHVSMPKSKSAIAKTIAFLDFTDSKVQPEKALELVKRKKFVKYAEIIKPSISGMIADTHFFPLVIGDERAVIFRNSILEALFNGVRREFGTAGEAMLYYEGFNVGSQAYETYVRLVGEENFDKLIEAAKVVNMTLGWGIIEVNEINRKRGTALLKIYQNFECAHGKNSGKAYSQFYRGAIAGFFTKLFGKKVQVEETRCIAKGDPYCEFHVKT